MTNETIERNCKQYHIRAQNVVLFSRREMTHYLTNTIDNNTVHKHINRVVK